MAVYTDPAAPFLTVLLVALAFVIVNFPSVSVWAGFGVALLGAFVDRLDEQARCPQHGVAEHSDGTNCHQSSHRRRGTQRLDDSRRQLTRRFSRRGVHIVEPDRRARSDVGVVRHPDDGPYARAEVGFDLICPHQR